MKNIVQAKNPKSGRYVKLDLDKGMVIAHKKSDGAYKNIKIIRSDKNGNESS